MSKIAQCAINIADCHSPPLRIAGFVTLVEMAALYISLRYILVSALFLPSRDRGLPFLLIREYKIAKLRWNGRSRQ